MKIINEFLGMGKKKTIADLASNKQWLQQVSWAYRDITGRKLFDIPEPNQLTEDELLSVDRIIHEYRIIVASKGADHLGMHKINFADKAMMIAECDFRKGLIIRTYLVGREKRKLIFITIQKISDSESNSFNTLLVRKVGADKFITKL